MQVGLVHLFQTLAISNHVCIYTYKSTGLPEALFLCISCVYCDISIVVVEQTTVPIVSSTHTLDPICALEKTTKLPIIAPYIYDSRYHVHPYILSATVLSDIYALIRVATLHTLVWREENEPICKSLLQWN